jgi:diguanylate cyclase (GGDEF)-like protein
MTDRRLSAIGSITDDFSRWLKRVIPECGIAQRGAWALIFLLGWYCNAVAQQYSFRRYTPADGLSNLAVGYLGRSSDGDMWVGTDGGLFRFDGTAFTTYDSAKGLPPDQVGGLQEDPMGHLWVTLVRGLYAEQAGRFAAIGTGEGPVTVDFRAPVAFLSPAQVIALRSGQVMALERSANGWREHPFFDGAQRTAIPDLGNVHRLYLTTDQTLWLSCGKHLCSAAAGKVHEWTEAEGVTQGDWNAFLADREGRLWVRSPSHLLVHEPQSPAFVLRDPPSAQLDELRNNPAMVLDPQGRLLVRTGVGLARWEGGQWKQFTAANGLPPAPIAAAELDDEDNVWLAMNGLGLWRWRSYDNLESWTGAQGLISEKIWSILRDPTGRLLLGTSSGCQMLDEDAARVVACPIEGLPRLTIGTIAVDKTGALWWGLNNGEIWRTPAGDTRAHLMFPESDDRPEISVIVFDRSGTGWVPCLDGGLFRLDPITARLDKVPLPGPPARLYDVTEDAEGVLWAAGSAGLFRKGRTGWSLIRASSTEGVPAVFDSVAATPDGSVWGAPDGKGLLRAAAADGQRREWVHADVVAKTTVYFVRADARGWLWLGTDQGVIIFDGHSWRRLDEDDGLIWNDTQVFGFLADRDGSVWIGTSAGLTHVRDPQQWMKKPKPLDLRIGNAQLGGKRLDPRRKIATQWQPNTAFDVHFSSHSYSRSPQTEFRYRLLGLSSSWFGSRNPDIHVPALDAGEYTLEAIAVDTPHARTSPTVSMSFEVLPPWWRTSAFRAVIAVSAAILLGLLWRWQSNKLRARRLALEAEYRERQALLERATRDALTGLWNRATILDALAREAIQAQRSGTALTIGIIDVDNFKQINDTYGHPGGDEVLRVLARRLGAQLRQCDWLGRYGGEEFMMVLPGLAPEEAETCAEEMRNCVSAEPFFLNRVVFPVTISVGVSWWDSRSDTVESLVDRTDHALYEAKRSGRNCVVFAPTIHAGLPSPPYSRHYVGELLDRCRKEAHRRGHEQEEEG